MQVAKARAASGAARRLLRLCGWSQHASRGAGGLQTRQLFTSVVVWQSGQQSSQADSPAILSDLQAATSDASWPEVEVRRWEAGRAKLAAMMGADPETFSERDVVEALRYLMPSRLSARDAHPLLKHPSKVFDKRKESAFDAHGRPLEPAFYSGFPAYHNLIYQIYQMGQRLDSQPAAVEDRQEVGVATSAPPQVWVKRKTLANIIAEELSDKQHQDLVSRLASLARHPRAAAISEFLDKFRRPHFGYRGSSAHPQLNARGQARAVGRRKSSVAVAHVSREGGGVSVNSQPLLSYFPLPEQRQQVLFPLVATETLGGVEVSARVRGGGKTGQAGAVRLAISKALLGLPGQHGEVLEGAGLLVRDPRAVERKKPGQKKARKKFAWVKR